MRNAKWMIVPAAVLAAIGLILWWWQYRAADDGPLAAIQYQILKAREPESFRRVLDAYERMVSGETSRATFVTVANQEFSAVVARRLPYASDESVLAMIRTMLPVARALGKKSPDACFDFWYPELGGNPDVERLVSADDQRRLMETQAEVIRSSAEHPAVAPTAEEAQRLLTGIIDDLERVHGEDVRMLARVADPAIDRAKVCEMTTSLYERIMTLPPDSAGKLIRGSAAGG